MATPLAGRGTVLTVSSDNSSFSTVGGANAASLDELVEQLDDTEFGDQARSSFGGLKNASAELTCDHDTADAGQAILNTAFAARSTIYLKLLYNGSAGQKITAKVGNRKTNPELGGKVTRTWSLVGIAAVDDV